jgi:hypothetical protein
MREIYPNKIRYTHVYDYSAIFFFFCIGFVVMVALGFAYGSTPGYFEAIVILVSAILGISLRISIRHRVFIDHAGIHIYSKHGGHELLLPRENYVFYRAKIAPQEYRGSSLIILSRAKALPIDLWYVACTEEMPTTSDVRKYELDLALYRLNRGQISEADLLEQPVIMLEFSRKGRSMEKFYRRFQEIWGRDTVPQ